MTENQEIAVKILKEKKMVKKGDQVILVGKKVYHNSDQPQMRVVCIEE